MLRKSAGLLLLAALSTWVGIGTCGCRADRPAEVPRDARRVAGGRPGQARKFDYTCATDGTAYVTDDWDNSLTWSGPVHAGDRIGIDVYGGRITVNDQTVYERRMRHTDHLVYVARSAAPVETR